MSEYIDLAKILIKMEKKENYHNFNKGFFKHVPNLEGYILKHKNNIIIINLSEKVNKNKILIQDKNFFIFNSDSLENFINYYLNNLPEFIKILFIPSKSNPRPLYGYYKKDGELLVNRKEARVVNNIYKNYLTEKSMHKVANSLNIDVSLVKNILNRGDAYKKTKPRIINTILIKKAEIIRAENRKS